MKKRPDNRTGATAVEFAVVAPVFFLIVFAAFEFSRLNVIRHTGDNAAYEASRLAIVPGATADRAIEEATRLMAIVGARGVEIEVDPPTLGPEAEAVTVTVRTPLDENGWIFPRFTRNGEFESSSTLRTERVQTR